MPRAPWPHISRAASWADLLTAFSRMGPRHEPMAGLVERIGSSRYAAGLYATASMYVLIIAQTPRFGHDEGVLKIWVEGGEFVFEFAEQPFVRRRWRKRCPTSEGFSALEHFLRMQGWFVEYGPAAPPAASAPVAPAAARAERGVLQRSLRWIRHILSGAP